MTFTKVLEDIKRLVGRELNSIRPGANVTVVEVTDERVELLNSRGRRTSRSIAELRKVWDALCTSPIVHVDSVLGGSGSSRNQPETIFANLPYIEWLKYHGKKHIRLVDSDTHEIGTLKRMDAMAERQLQIELAHDDLTEQYLRTLVVSSDIVQVSNELERATGLSVEPVEAGVYLHRPAQSLVVLRSALPESVSPGTYAIVYNSTEPPAHSVAARVAGLTVHFVDGNHAKVAFIRQTGRSASAQTRILH
ncbi:MAG TPA: hypothetical protein GX512_05250 [Firmicutes bacterium]|nr:hypothetical protein [Candidatus Fermentithermobacillaceae bacterium]